MDAKPLFPDLKNNFNFILRILKAKNLLVYAERLRSALDLYFGLSVEHTVHVRLKCVKTRESKSNHKGVITSPFSTS